MSAPPTRSPTTGRAIRSRNTQRLVISTAPSRPASRRTCGIRCARSIAPPRAARRSTEPISTSTGAPPIAHGLEPRSPDPIEQQRRRRLAEPRREAMLDTLNYLRQRYGGAAQYLLGAGLNGEQLERLRARLVQTEGA